MKTIVIEKIEQKHYEGYVYNIELESNREDDQDDLFWIEQLTGIITHNCLPKDINSLIATMESLKIDPLLLKAVWAQNKKLRKNWDWAKNPSAVQKEKI